MNDKTLETDHSTPRNSSPGNGHGWMMIGCGAMVAVILILVATSAVPATLLLGALACAAMMGVMMLMMSRTMGGHDHSGSS